MGLWHDYVDAVFDEYEKERCERVAGKERYKSIECPKPEMIPHHRNLGVKPWTANSEIRAAWKRISTRLHPDKFRGNAQQKEDAAAAMLLVNEAYENLVTHRKNWGRLYWYKSDWTRDPRINEPERERRQKDDRLAKHKESEKEVDECFLSARRKPMLWTGKYKTYAQCDQQEVWFCEEFWVDFSHVVIDNTLPLRYSNALWDKDLGWKIKKKREESTR